MSAGRGAIVSRVMHWGGVMQPGSYWRTAGVTLAILVALGGLAMMKPPRYQHATDTLGKRVWRTLFKDELNREARERNTVAYYEGLLNESSRVSSMNSLITGERRFEADNWDRVGRRMRSDFRYWEHEPGYVNRDPTNPLADLSINSHGMADKEYELEAPPHTWRIALVGDSITRGQGVPMFRNFETLLEERLNATHAPGHSRIEVLNFAVNGYRVTQLVDATLDWAQRFSPNVYVLPLSELSVFRRWADHLTTLVQNGIDLKYDYLRTVVAESGLKPSDPSGTADAKLARFRLSTVEWAVRTMRSHAESRGAHLVVVLLPNGNDPEILQEEFEGVREVVRDANVPMIDLLSIFELVEEPLDYRVSETDLHPNERGHRLLQEHLYTAITSDDTLRKLFGIGVSAAEAAR
jgi:lysophospholipase L1-like esterase